MDLISQGLLLGLSTGIFCLGTCAPILAPALLAAAPGWRGSAAVVGELALGRLVAYLLFGAAVGALGASADAGGLISRRAEGAVTLCLALVLVAQVFGASLGDRFFICRALPREVRRAPIAMGFLTGLSFCPPFLLALTTALGSGGVSSGMLFFGAFFVGTSLYLAPLTPLGALGRWEAPRLIGRMAAALSATFFALSGLARLAL